MRYILNIGLNIPGTDHTMHPELAKDAIRNMLTNGERILSATVHASDTEPTLVVLIDGFPPATSELEYLSELLLQDCIAYCKADSAGGALVRTGGLIGPKAAEWGPFNPAYFILPDGARAG
jgi:hypothetical protein